MMSKAGQRRTSVNDGQRLPLHVYQVLEEEYLSLHGPLDEEQVIRLPDDRMGAERYRLVRARRDWFFHQGHIKNPLGLADKLLSARTRRSGPSSPAADEPPRHPHQALWTYLAHAISAETLRQVLNQVRPFAGNLNALFDGNGDNRERPARDALGELEHHLNTLLSTGRNLYTAARFTDITLSGPINALIEKATPLSGEDLVHLNRLLLEEAFPDEFEKVHNIRLAAIHQRFHQLESHAALCLSGGGIRSGTFALGLLQGFARHNLLKEFDYLSTVSGGGYIGSWLTAWLHRDANGLSGVTRKLANEPPQSRVDPDAEPVLHLRSYSNFITPKVGLLTADTWAFVAIYLRNLLLNWTVIIPLILGFLLVPRLYLSAILASPQRELPVLGIEARYYLLALGALLSIAAVTYTAFNRPYFREQLRVRSPFWFKRGDQRNFLKYCLLPLIIAAILLTIYWAWSLDANRGQPKEWWLYAAFGGGVTFTGWALSTLILRRVAWSHLREISISEMLVLTFAGVVGGLLFWTTERLLDTSPVVPKITASWVSWGTEFYTLLAIPAFLGGFLLAMTLFVGLTSHSKRFTDEDREWWARANAWILIVIIAWLVFAALVIFGPLGLLYSPTLAGGVGGVSGLVALLAGRSAATAATEDQSAQKSLLASIMSMGLPFLAMIFLAVVVAVLSLLTSALLLGIALAVIDPEAPQWLSRLQLFPTGVVVSGFPETSQLGYLHLLSVHHATFLLVAALALFAIAFGLGMARLINLNRFSLHAGYRDRLIRAFLGASRRPGDRKPNPFTGFDPLDNIRMHELRPALFHEDDFDNIGRFAIRLRDREDAVSQYLWDERITPATKREIEAYSPDALPSQALKAALIEDLNRVLEDRQKPLYKHAAFASLLQPGDASGRAPDTLEGQLQGDYGILVNRRLLQRAYEEEIRKKYPPPHKLLHVVNIALNLVGGHNLAWQQRRAEPFSVSPLHCGCFRLGYRRARDYGGDDGISMGTAVAISGAAASSNMGYYTTSPVLSMLLTLFNVRLGWWLGNPGPAGATTYRRQSPKYSVTPILAEAFGLTDDQNKYVYLSDGGHFENLALYEMVLRRCKIIVVSDGGADENYEFNDLGNAVRKIRIDLGVPIEFVDVPIWSNKLESEEHQEKRADRGLFWAVGRIRYSCVDIGADDGVLIYVKPAVYGSEPQDVLHYKRSHKTFPHETTADQFFDEPQFESYRALGSFVVERMIENASGAATLSDLVAGLYRQQLPNWHWPPIEAAWLERSS